MGDHWTRERVVALAPDAASAKAGESLAGARKWKLLGSAEQVLWGEIQGSGAKPYQTRIDLSEPAFKCSCPSRKFPCKHAVGLMLTYAADAAALTIGTPPGWVSEWLTDREQRARQKADKSEAKESAPRDEAAAARRTQARQVKIEDGLDALALWMDDLVRQGLGAAQALPSEHWETMAARLVDAQAPGLARRVRELSSDVFSGEGWQERVLYGMGRMALLVAAYRRADALPAELVADLRGEVGWSRAKEEALAQPAVADTWCVVGRRNLQEDQLRIQRTWLCGEQTRRWALVLQFAAGSQPMDLSLSVGAKFSGELAFFPGAVPLRAIIKTSAPSGVSLDGLPHADSATAALDAYAAGLARNPWIERWPIALANVALHARIDGGRFISCELSDEDGTQLTLQSDDSVTWQLLAIAGGRHVSVFGEWDGRTLLPLSAAADGRFFSVVASEKGRSLIRIA